jgi:hypothetical protein
LIIIVQWELRFFVISRMPLRSADKAARWQPELRPICLSTLIFIKKKAAGEEDAMGGKGIITGDSRGEEHSALPAHQS